MDLFQVHNGIVYYVEYGDDELGISGLGDCTLYAVSAEDGSTALSIPVTYDFGEQNCLRWQLQAYCADLSGNVYVAKSASILEDGKRYAEERYVITKYDSDGNLVWEGSLGEDMNMDLYDSYGNISGCVIDRVISMAVDAAGNLFMATTDGNPLVMDAEGNYVGRLDMTRLAEGKRGREAFAEPKQLEVEDMIEGAASQVILEGISTFKDGKVYASVSDYRNMTSVCSLWEMDLEVPGIERIYENFEPAQSFTGGVANEIYSKQQYNLQYYDAASGETGVGIHWIDADMDYLEIAGMEVVSDSQIRLVSVSAADRLYEVVMLTRTRAEDAPKKTELVLGSMNSSIVSELQKSIRVFNRQSQEYRIVIKSYLDESILTPENQSELYKEAASALNMDILMGRGPDMLLLEEVNVAQLQNNGVFEDLYPWLDASDRLSREDYFSNILEANTYDGRLVCIPKEVTLTTLVADASQVGSGEGWTLEEMLYYAAEHPQAQLLDFYTRNDLLQLCMTYAQDAFVDWEQGTCDFEQETFTQILEVAQRCPETIDWNNTGGYTHEKMKRGEVLLYKADIGSISDIQAIESRFADTAYIGIPSEDGTPLCLMEDAGMVAILQTSRHKEGAWSFLESYLVSDRGFDGFATRIEQFEAQAQEALDTKYKKDAEGNIRLDQDERPMLQYSSSMSYIDQYFFRCRENTQEHVERVRALLSCAKQVSYAERFIHAIILEETESYFTGQKTAEQVASSIQSRVQLYVQENSN